MIGRQVGDYRIVQELGEGGMGMVFKGEHIVLGQVVAVKSLHASLMNNQAAKDRFVREAQALARLNHPNIIGLKNFVNDAGGCFIIMEFAEGEDLEEKLQRMGLIPPAQCIPWFIEACRGLEYANQQGCIHRDIKPSNIIVHPSGTTKLLDFGTAKLVDAQRLTQQGMTLGTVIYMSKEQLLGKKLDARSDVYSLGVTLYECVTGQLPFYDEEERKLVVKIAKEDPIPPSQHYPGISPQLEQVILKSMAKDPALRFQSAHEMELALAALVGGGAAAPAPPAAVTPAPATPAPTPTPAPAPAPTPAPVAAVQGDEGGGLLFQPLFLAGIIVEAIGLAGGIPLIFANESTKTVGLVLLLVGLVLGALLMILGILRNKAAPAAATAGAAGGNKPNCPSCGRALLAGMAECPFCNPQAAPPPSGMTQPPAPIPMQPPAPSVPAPQPMAFNPGGTLNVNSAHAAQKFGTVAPGQVAATAATGAMVQIIDGNDKGRQYQIAPTDRFTIGRAPTCGCTLNDPGVSGTHAAISFEGSRLFVEDTGSRNGVFVNNQKINKQYLNSGDLIVIGSTRLLVNLG